MKIRDWRLFVALVGGFNSSTGGGARARDLRPVRGLGVSDGVGRPDVVLRRFSGVKDNGRRLRGRGREDADLTKATVGAAIADSSTGTGESSESSSSSSTSVWS